MDRMVKNVVHELGHAYDLQTGHKGPTGEWIRGRSTGMTLTRNVLRPNMAEGEASPEHWDWQQSGQNTPSEIYADMFIAWTYNTWNTENALMVDAAKAWMP
jgi:hypothetical protein